MMSIKRLTFLAVTSLAILFGCAHQPTEYKVVESLAYKKGYMDGFYKEGVTEEAIKPNQAYKITAKLDVSSTKVRAKNMVLVHAAKLTLAAGSDEFMVKRAHSTIGCGHRTSQNGNVSVVKDAWPVAFSFIKILSPSQSNMSIPTKTYDARAVLSNFEKGVLQGPNAEQVSKNKEENILHCQLRR